MRLRLGLIGVALAAIAGTFAYLGGWFTPNELTPARLTDAFETIDGHHPGFRRNHAKGLGVSGYFESNGNGVRLSRAAVFEQGRVPVIGRFSLGGGNPNAADAPGSVRGLGLQFAPSHGQEWRMAMITLPVFPVRTPQGFHDLMFASRPDPKTGKPDPEKMKAFQEHHPENGPALKILQKRVVSSGFSDSTFHSVNAFRFTNGKGETVPVRWEFVPMQTVKTADNKATTQDKNYLFDALIAQIHHAPLQWRLLVIVGEPGDPTNDATLPWPESREKVDVGTLTLDHVESDETSPATTITFDPLVLPDGMAPSDDPLLSARSAVYSQSFTRRAGEPQGTPPVTPAEVRKGE